MRWRLMSPRMNEWQCCRPTRTNLWSISGPAGLPSLPPQHKHHGTGCASQCPVHQWTARQRTRMYKIFAGLRSLIYARQCTIMTIIKQLVFDIEDAFPWVSNKESMNCANVLLLVAVHMTATCDSPATENHLIVMYRMLTVAWPGEGSRDAAVSLLGLHV